MAFEEFLIGKRHRLSWVNETSHGSGGDMAADGEVIGLNARIDPDFNENWMEILGAGADNRSVQDHALGPLDYPFTLTFTNVDWKFLQYLGYGVVDAGGPNYTHTFTQSNAIQSFKLEWAMRHTTAVVVTLTGCVALGGTISFTKASGEGAEGFLTVTLRCVAKSAAIGSSVTTLAAGNITRSPYQWRHVKATINNNEVVEINSGEMLIENGIDVNDSRYCNSTLDREIGEPISKVQRVSGSLNANMKDSTFLTLWAAGATISNCKLEFIQNDTSNKLVAEFSGFKLPQAFPSTDLESVTSTDLPFVTTNFTSLVATDTIATY
jgi:hypothetical protein